MKKLFFAIAVLLVSLTTSQAQCLECILNCSSLPPAEVGPCFNANCILPCGLITMPESDDLTVVIERATEIDNVMEACEETMKAETEIIAKEEEICEDKA